MSKQTDISQLIRSYLNGELDARAMHSLERQAQDDPFLMDALDGFSQAGVNLNAGIEDLQSRLKQKLPTGRGRIFRLSTVSIAASLAIIFLAVAGIYTTQLLNNPDKEKTKTEQLTKNKPLGNAAPLTDNNTVTDTAEATGQTDITADQPAANNSTGNTNVNTPIGVSANQPGKTTVGPQPVAVAGGRVTTRAAKPASGGDSSSVEERIVLNFNPAAQGAADKKRPAEAGAEVPYNVVPGRLAEVAATKQEAAAKAAEESVSKAKAANTFSGRINDAAGPIPGAKVTIKGTSISTITDLHGRFNLPVQPKRVVLDVDMIGYLNKQVKVNSKDSVVIDMKPKQAPNSVITGYGSAACCWDVYDKYLKDNAISPDGKTGTVKLSFVVNPDNSLTDFRILKSVSAQTDLKAIEIVKNGPAWLHDASGKPKEVTLRIKFENKK